MHATALRFFFCSFRSTSAVKCAHTLRKKIPPKLRGGRSKRAKKSIKYIWLAMQPQPSLTTKQNYKDSTPHGAHQHMRALEVSPPLCLVVSFHPCVTFQFRESTHTSKKSFFSILKKNICTYRRIKINNGSKSSNKNYIFFHVTFSRDF